MLAVRRFVTLILAIFLAGCGTPQVVKSLSTEQLSVLRTSRDTLAKYFSLIEQIIANQVAVSKFEEDKDLKKQMSLLQEKYLLASEKAPADKTALLGTLSTNIKKVTEEANDAKRKYDQYYSELVAKHRALLAMVDNLIAGQDTLNNYIQLQKADESIGNSIFSAIGTDKDKMRKYADEVNGILANLKSIKEQSK